MAAAQNGNGYTRIATVSGAVLAGASILGSMLASIYAMQDRLTRQEVALNEIETQFCGVSHDVNLMHASDLRLVAVLWKKAFGDEFPIGNAYYPEYGSCRKSK